MEEERHWRCDKGSRGPVVYHSFWSRGEVWFASSSRIPTPGYELLRYQEDLHTSMLPWTELFCPFAIWAFPTTPLICLQPCVASNVMDPSLTKTSVPVLASWAMAGYVTMVSFVVTYYCFLYWCVCCLSECWDRSFSLIHHICWPVWEIEGMGNINWVVLRILELAPIWV